MEEELAVEWEFRRQTIICSEALLRILRAALATNGDDLETTVIHLAVACGSASGALRNASLTAAPPGRIAPEHYGGVSRRQIALSTGLPRETVRRKIAVLLARGDLVPEGARVRVRSGALEDVRNFEFARTLLREFGRAGAQAPLAVDQSTPRADPDRVTQD
jgi:hypothetical protein